MTTLPNFFIAGVAKAGTTSLYHYLEQHPQIYMSPIKEPGFFAATDLASGQYHVRPRVVRDPAALEPYLHRPTPPGDEPLVLDWTAYLALFRGVRDEAAIGEASVGYYFHLPGVPRAIRDRVPDARLIFVLRDVAERLFAVYLGGRWLRPGLSFRAWFELAQRGGEEARDIRGSVVAGRYATHLRRFLTVFPAHQMRMFLYEDYRADARRVLRDIFSFLGVDPGVAVDLSRRYNEAVAPRLRVLHVLRQRLAARAPRALGWIPERVRRALRTLYYVETPRVAMAPEDRQMVIDHYRDEILRTGDLLGRDLSDWLRITPPSPRKS